ncbi:DUF1206 domain-containing protein [Nostocoides sp.]|uniref:DUF1206 domain-containing protein n=1 Tax=Nostocoides sp. TaxID=1917966 RepID=UPI002D1FB0D9|nr:DUF1206 domain-containing protein [Tetrasphaera sp.]
MASMETPDVERHAREVGDSRPVEMGARLGYAASGLIHLVLGWIAVQIAWSRSAASADQSGAFATLAKQPFGELLLWACVAGFALLAVWHLTATITGAAGPETADRVKAAAKMIMYAALGWTAFTFASGGRTSSKEQTKDFTAGLMSSAGGRLLVGVLGLGIIAAGGYHVYKGWRSKFLEDLVQHPGTWAVLAGRVGYLAKGIALAVMGLLFVVGAMRGSAAKTTGLDGALHSLREQPFGSILLTLVGAGIAAYGVYSFARARYARV